MTRRMIEELNMDDAAKVTGGTAPLTTTGLPDTDGLLSSTGLPDAAGLLGTDGIPGAAGLPGTTEPLDTTRPLDMAQLLSKAGRML